MIYYSYPPKEKIIKCSECGLLRSEERKICVCKEKEIKIENQELEEKPLLHNNEVKFNKEKTFLKQKKELSKNKRVEYQRLWRNKNLEKARKYNRIWMRNWRANQRSLIKIK
jgi:hypothetical protein